VKMLHGTTSAGERAILRTGIRARKAKGRDKTVWLCTPGMYGFAVGHVMRRHGVPPERVTVLVVDVPRSWLVKVGRKGVRHTGGRDIPRERIVSAYVVKRLGE
jgi:hypothetical protein